MKSAGENLVARAEETDKLFNFRPVFFAAAFLCLGISFAYLRFFKGVSAWWGMLLLPFAVPPFCFCSSRRQLKRTAISVGTLALSVVIGYGLLIAQLRDFSDTRNYDGEMPVVGRVVEKTDYGEYTGLTLTDLCIDGKEEKGRLKAYLPTAVCQGVALSDELIVTGSVRTNAEFFDEYGFRAEDIGDSVRFGMNAELCAVSGSSFDIFASVYTRIENTLYKNMHESSASVTLALLTGNTDGIESDLLDNMRMGGIAHIFAVSGLHIGALYAFCLMAFRKKPLHNLPKPLRFALLATILVFYSGVCGFTPSVLRATTLCLLAYAVKLTGLHIDFLEMLGVAAIGLLLFSPVALFEVGFQLTFLSCLGIAILKRPVQSVIDGGVGYVGKIFPKQRTEEQCAILAQGDSLPLGVGDKVYQWCSSVLSVSIAAQIASAPVLMCAFGFLSGWALLLNFLFVPIIGCLFSALLLCVATACVVPVTAGGVLYLPELLCSLLMLVFELADFSSFALTGIKLTGGGILCYYAGWLFLSDKWNISKKSRVVYAVLCFAVFVSAVGIANA